jgi:hypothetical protein
MAPVANVFLGIPLYTRNADFGSLLTSPSAKHHVHGGPHANSLIPRNCNCLWCDALNGDYQWYAQLHGDCVAQEFWIDTLIELAEKHGADFVSASVPIKEIRGAASGCTSTAISLPGRPFDFFTRLTQAQINFPSFPDTFDIHAAAAALEQLPDELRVENVPREYLLANTGCMVCRLDRPWREKIWFDNPNRIDNINGRWQPLCLPEDWHFTRRIQEEGGKVMVTRLVPVKHWGLFDYDSREVWGRKRDI